MKTLGSTLALAAIVVATSGCSSAAPGAEKIRVTSNPKDVAGCKVAGQVSTHTSSPGNETRLRNAALTIGGGTIFVTSSGLSGPYQGMVYNCGGTDMRQPMPVAVVPVATPA